MCARGIFAGLTSDRLALTLAVIVPLTALPFASNRSIWWLFWTMVLAALACLHVWGASRQPLGLRLRPGVIGWGAAAMALPVWAFVQALPLAHLMPASWVLMRTGLEGLGGRSISLQPDIALTGALRFMGYLILIGLVIRIANRAARVRGVATILFCGVVAQAIWALLALGALNDYAFSGPKVAYLGMATGSFVNRNSLATFLGFGILIGLGLLVERAIGHKPPQPRAKPRITNFGFAGAFILLGMSVQFIALLATQSRLGLAATLVAVVATLSILRSRAGCSSRRMMAEGAVLIGLVSGLIAIFAGGDGVMNRLLFTASEAQGRIALYQQTVEIIALRPLTGFGMDSFGSAFEAFRAPPLLGNGNFDLSHNSYLMLWAEFGLIFGSIPPTLLALVAVILWRRMSDPAGFAGMALAGIGALILGALHSLGDFSLEIPANTYLFVTIIGLGLGRRSAPHAAPARGTPDLTKDQPRDLPMSEP